MTRSQRFIHLIEQDDNSADKAPSSKELADKLLQGLNIKPKIGKARSLPATETITIKEVDGEEVRDEHDQNFTTGGNGAAYPDYVPEDEIWIEAGHSLEGNLANIVHEFIERMVMFYLGWDYEAAHALAANPVESVIRWAYRVTNPDKEESLFKKKSSSEVENWVRTFDEAIRKKYHE